MSPVRGVSTWWTTTRRWGSRTMRPASGPGSRGESNRWAYEEKKNVFEPGRGGGGGGGVLQLWIRILGYVTVPILNEKFKIIVVSWVFELWIYLFIFLFFYTFCLYFILYLPLWIRIHNTDTNLLLWHISILKNAPISSTGTLYIL